MSARKRFRLTIRAAAAHDIEDILIHTGDQWGSGQRRRYRSDLRRGMRSLLDYPEIGPERFDLFQGCRSLVVKRHVIFYAATDAEVIVLRVLHESQDPSGKVVP